MEKINMENEVGSFYIVTPIAERLLQFLQQPDQRHALVLGSAGVGKTTLLIFLSEQLRRGGAVVAMVGANDERSIDLLTTSIYRALGVSISEEASAVHSWRTDHDFSRLIKKVKESGKSTYLFIDDIDSISEESSLAYLLDNLLRESQGVLRIVLSSRPVGFVSRMQRSRIVNTFEISALSLAESVTFLRNSIGGSVKNEDISRAVEIAGGSPLALRLIASAIKSIGGLDGITDSVAINSNSLQDVLIRRIFDVDRRTISQRKLLGCLAVLKEATIHQLQEVTGLDHQVAIDAIESLRNDGLVSCSQSDWSYSHRILLESASKALFEFHPTPPGMLSFGAEAAERDSLLESQFVEPPELSRLISGEKTIVLGDRGAGKSAIFRSLEWLAEKRTEQETDGSGALIALSKDPASFLQRYNAIAGNKINADHFKAVWMLFCAAQAASEVHSRVAGDRSYREYVSSAWNLLRQVGWEKSIRGQGGLRKAWGIIKNFLPRKVKFTVGPIMVEPAFEKSDSPSGRGGMDIVEFIKETDKILKKKCSRLLIVVDQIDEFHKHDRKMQEAMVQGLFLAEAQLSQTNSIRLVALLRTDLYEVYDVQEKNKFVSRTIRLQWTWPQIVDQMLRRAFVNASMRAVSEKITDVGINENTAELHLRILFPASVEGLPVNDWLHDSLKNGYGRVSPRQVILLLTFLKQRYKGDRAYLPVFSESELIESMRDVSESAFEEVVNDFRVATNFVRNCKVGRISSFKVDDVEALFDPEEGDQNLQIELLERLGFLQREVVNENGTRVSRFIVPRHYSRCWS